jgi:transducin (beta)-like 1
MDDDFSFLQPLDLITKDPYELQKIIKAKKENLQKDRHEENGKHHNEYNQENEREHAQEREKEKKGREKEQEQDKEKIEKDREQEKGKDKEKSQQDHFSGEKCEDKVIMEYEENGAFGGDLRLPLLLQFYL